MTQRRDPWKQTVLRRAHQRALHVRRKQRYADVGRIQVTVGPTYVQALSAAAERRGLTVGAYMRRAIAAFVAADTGEAFTDLLRDVPHPLGQKHGHFDPGTGHGVWHATPYSDDTDGISAS